MYFIGLACDYDGTLAQDGAVDEPTLAALRRFKKTGRKLILVSGREIDDLRRAFPEIELFDVVIAENGALLFLPATKTERVLAPPPPVEFVQRLKDLDLEPLSVGRSIVATWEPNEKIALDVIRELGLELQIIFNKGAVMILPPGINKASGFAAALSELGLSAQNVVGVGDAENDHAFLQASGCAVAVANALPLVQAKADLVTQGARGAGVAELIEKIVDRDVEAFDTAMKRHCIDVGANLDGSRALLHPYRSVLIAGLSGGGKSTFATALLERLIERDFQVCILDPEGDYAKFQPAIAFGDAKAKPQISQIRELLERPGESVVVNMLAVDFADRPALFSHLLAAFAPLRARTGRPHQILVDEAHHLLPAQDDANSFVLPQDLPPMILLTVDPATVSSVVLEHVDELFIVGHRAAETIAAFCRALSISMPEMPEMPPEPDQALHWDRRSDEKPRIIAVEKPRQARERHTRKYAEGSLGEDASFYFRGPSGALNLRAQNLTLFVQIAEGIDDETWIHHLRARDYSKWARQAIKDEELAKDFDAAEEELSHDARASRSQIRDAIERRYTAPASKCSSS